MRGNGVTMPGRTKRTLGALVGTWVALMVLPVLSAAATDEVAATFRFSASDLRFEVFEGYDVVSLEGTDRLTTPGEPMLPALNAELLLPPGKTAAAVSVDYGGTVILPGEYTVLPAPRPVSFSTDKTAEIPHQDDRTYRSVLPYPCEVARLAGAGSLSGYSIAEVAVTPLQYVPATGELMLHTKVTVTVAVITAGDLRHSPAPSAAAGRLVAARIANPEALTLYEPRGTAGEAADGISYLVICPDEFVSAFEPLAEWKTRKGVPAAIVTVEEILSDPLFEGGDAAEEIRNCIRHYRDAHGLAWVLLGGDTASVPARAAYDFFHDLGIPCDLYYSDLDGSWNEDGDSRWGEVGEDSIDMHADVYVGRAPVETVAEAETFVEKVLLYEGGVLGLPDDHQLRMLFLAEILWDDPDPYTDGGEALDMIESESVPGRFAPVTKLYQSAGSLDHGAAMSQLNAGCGIVVHEGHANIAAVGLGPDALTAADLSALTNGSRVGLWYSIGCWSAAIDYDTFGEHWLNNANGGGVAYVGNSRYGWACPGYPGQCVSDLFSRRFFESLFVKELSHAGLVHADAKEQYVSVSRDDDYMLYAMYELNLLGDPEMPIWTDAPSPLDVSHTCSVESGGAVVVEVGVTSQGTPVEGAVVCLCDLSQSVYEISVTGPSGQATLTVEAGDISGPASLTVTAGNSVPMSEAIQLDTGETGVEDVLVATTELLQNYPNPFNPVTSIAFAMASPGRVDLAVYDASGRKVAVLVAEDVDAGLHRISWDGRSDTGHDVASGVYFARMLAEGQHFESKMILMR